MAKQQRPKTKQFHTQLRPGAREALAEVARELGLFAQTTGLPSIAALLDGIASGELVVKRAPDR